MKALIIATAVTLSVSAPAASANVLTDLANEVRQEVQLANLVSKHIDLSEIKANLRASAVQLFERMATTETEQATATEAQVVEAESKVSDEKAPE